MSELQFRPLPTQADYIAATKLQSHRFKQLDGAAEVMMNIEARAMMYPDSMASYEMYKSAIIAHGLEPTDRFGRSFDSNNTISFAFQRGALMAFPLLSIVHGDVGPEDIADAVSNNIASRQVDMKSGTWVSEVPLLSLGRNGLDLIGKIAMTEVARWTGEVMKGGEKRMRLITMLGAGAVLRLGYAVHEYNNLMIAERAFANADSTQHNETTE